MSPTARGYDSVVIADAAAATLADKLAERVAMLDDPTAIAACDLDAMFAAIASSGAQVRAASCDLTGVNAGAIAAVSEWTRPRAVVIAGMGGSAMSGDVAAAIAGDAAVPVSTLRGYTLPAWVGPDDVVIAVSCSGGTEETVAIADQAQRRGIRWAAVSAPSSALASAAASARAPWCAIDPGGRAPRASLWALTIPVVALLTALGVVDSDVISDGALAGVADALDARTAADGADVVTNQNAAKSLGVLLATSLPIVWGTTPLASVAAYRTMAQLAENADHPALWGALPEANHNQVVLLDGTSVQARASRLVLIRDTDEHPQVTKRAEVSSALAAERSVPVTELGAESGTSLERAAQLLQRIDLASFYAAVVLAIDPSRIDPITRLKERIL